MRYLALATDYDGTLALHGRVHESTVRSLEKVLTTNRKLLLVTGRELDDLLNVFPHPHLFDWIVAENGLVLCWAEPQVVVHAVRNGERGLAFANGWTNPVTVHAG